MRYVVYVLIVNKTVSLRVHATAAAALADCQARTLPGQLDADAAAQLAGLEHGRAVRFMDRVNNPLIVRAVDTSRVPASTSPRDVERYVCDTLAAFGLVGWRFGWNNRKRACGLCNYQKREVSLSRHYVSLNTAEDIRHTTLHEVAHALVGPGHGHKWVWRSMALSLGIRASTCNAKAEMPKGKWTATCGCPGQVHTMHRKPKRLEGWRCRRCQIAIVWVGPGAQLAAAAS